LPRSSATRDQTKCSPCACFLVLIYDRQGRLSIPQRCPFSSPVQLLAAKEFTDGAPGLIDGHVGTGAGAGIGVCDGNLAERDPGLLHFFPIGIEQRIRREVSDKNPARCRRIGNCPRGLVAALHKQEGVSLVARPGESQSFVNEV